MRATETVLSTQCESTSNVRGNCMFHFVPPYDTDNAGRALFDQRGQHHNRILVAFSLCLSLMVMTNLIFAQDPRAAQLEKHIENKEWTVLKDFTDVTSLDLTQVPIRHSELKHLHSLTALKTLSLRGANFKQGILLKDEAIALLPPTLQELDLHGDHFSTSALPYFAHLKHLTHLELHGTRIGEKGNADFSILPSLTHLSLGRITAETASSCSKLNSLESLSFSCGNLTENTILALGQLPSLNHLEIRGYWTPCPQLEYAKRMPKYSNAERQIHSSVRSLLSMPAVFNNEIQLIMQADPTAGGANQHLKATALRLPEKVDNLRAAARTNAEKEYANDPAKLAQVDRWLCEASGGMELLEELPLQQTMDKSVWIGCPKEVKFAQDQPTAGSVQAKAPNVSLSVRSRRLRDGENGDALIDDLLREPIRFTEPDEVHEYRRRRMTFKSGPALEMKQVIWWRKAELPFTELERTVVIGDRLVTMTVTSTRDISDQAAYRWFDSLEINEAE